MTDTGEPASEEFVPLDGSPGEEPLARLTRCSDELSELHRGGRVNSYEPSVSPLVAAFAFGDASSYLAAVHETKRWKTVQGIRRIAVWFILPMTILAEIGVVWLLRSPLALIPSTFLVFPGFLIFGGINLSVRARLAEGRVSEQIAPVREVWLDMITCLDEFTRRHTEIGTDTSRESLEMAMAVFTSVFSEQHGLGLRYIAQDEHSTAPVEFGRKSDPLRAQPSGMRGPLLRAVANCLDALDLGGAAESADASDES